MKKIVVLLIACLFVLCGCDTAVTQAEVTREEITQGAVTETEKVCTVTFDSQGGSAVESQVVAWGDKALEPLVPTKECLCEFDGWYLGDEKWSFIGYTVTEDMTLTAKWFNCFTCLGLNDKEFEILDSLKIFKEQYTWRDVEDIQKSDSYLKDAEGNKMSDEDAVEYKITFRDGYVFTITVCKSCL